MTPPSPHFTHAQDLLHLRHRIECPVKCIQGVLYVRISTQIYNRMEDYEKLEAAIRGMLENTK